MRALAPDGKVLATGNMVDGTINLWNVSKGQRIRELAGGNAFGPSFSADGRYLVFSSGRRTVRLVEVATGREVRRLETPDHRGWFAMSPDIGMLATTGPEKTVRIWDFAAAKELRRLHVKQAADDYPFRLLLISPDGKVLAGSEQAVPVVHMWDLATGKERNRVEVGYSRLNTSMFSSVVFSPDSRYIATGEGNAQSPSQLRLWEVATAREVRQFAPPEAFRNALGFSPDGRTLVAGGPSSSLRLYEVATGEMRATLESHQGSVVFAGFSPNGKILVSAGSDNTALVWDLARLLHVDARQLSAGKLHSHWSDLLSTDAAKAYRAVWTLALAPEQSVEFLRTRLKPIAAADANKTALLIRDLDSSDFSRRKKAAEELGMLEAKVEPALRKALKASPSLEVRRRIEQILNRLEPAQSPELRRGVRAIEALEQCRTVPARKLLETLAQGLPGVRLTEDARTTLRRLTSR